MAYVKKQALANSKVIHIFDMKNSLLLNMANEPTSNYIEVMNNLIPDGVIKIKRDSKNIREKVRVLVWKVKDQVKKLNRQGSKLQREKYLGKWSKLTILVGDIMTAHE